MTLSCEDVQKRAASDWPAASEHYFLLRVIDTGKRKEQIMRTVFAIITVTLLAIGPAAAGSAKSFAPGHQMKGAHGQPGASYWAPGHQKRLFNQHSARLRSPGHLK
jgi:hypothetical protein